MDSVTTRDTCGLYIARRPGPDGSLEVAYTEPRCGPVYYERILKSQTVRRPKPSTRAALYKLGTPRYVFVKKEQYGTATWNEGIHIQSGIPASVVSRLSLIPQLDQLQYEIANDFTAVSGKLRAKIKAQKVNLAQSCAEFRQASAMFGSLARDLVSTYRSLRTGVAFRDFVRWVQAPRTQQHKQVANRWLEYQYGLKPLVSDIFGLSEAAADRAWKGFPVLTTATKRYESYGVDAKAFWEVNQRVEAVQRIRSMHYVGDSTVKKLSELGFTNPALLAWELLPYSFVVDWMFNVGDYLGSLDATVGIRDLCVQRGYKSEVTFTGKFMGQGDIHGVHTEIQRFAVEYGIALPKLTYSPSSSLTAVLNGMALLRQLR